MLASFLLLGSAGSAAAGTVTALDANGTVLLNGAKVFPIVLAKGPPRDGTTPSGVNALDETVGAGVNFFKVGPATTAWTSSDITDANLWDEAVAARGAYTWVNLSTLSQATPGSATDSLLQQVVTTLKGDPTGSSGIGMWKGADEPWWSGIAPSALQFAFCRATSRGDPSWCANEPWLDQDHVWATIEAPKGTAADLQPYSAVTDAHGVDDYPVTLSATNPDLHQVGVWTKTVADATPNAAVWTTLQVCASGSYDSSGNYVLPTRLQERYMIYDAIINGARNLAFYGGNNVNCWNGSSDNTYGWNWTFWNSVLKGLIQEINARSPLAPMLLNPATTRSLASTDPSTEVISRQGNGSSDLWVIAAHNGLNSSSPQSVTISGLPATATGADVYTESRTVPVSGGSLTDSFGPWAVHVYHLTSAPAAPAPTISSFSPSSGPVGTTVTITGANLTGATGVAFSGTAASTFTVTSDTQITATVPAAATTGPVSVTTPSGTGSSSTSFAVTATPAPDFALSASPATLTVVRGSTGTATIKISATGGFTGTVTLSANVSPTGLSPTLSPTAVSVTSTNGGSSTLTIPTTSSTKPGSYTITVTGTAGSLTRTTQLTAQVKRK